MHAIILRPRQSMVIVQVNARLSLQGRTFKLKSKVILGMGVVGCVKTRELT